MAKAKSSASSDDPKQKVAKKKEKKERPAPTTNHGVVDGIVIEYGQIDEKEIYVKKSNDVEANKNVLTENINSGLISLDHVIWKLKSGGNVRRGWSAAKDNMHDHVNELLEFTIEWKVRLVGVSAREGTGKMFWPHRDDAGNVLDE